MESDGTDKEVPRIFRKPMGQIVVLGKVNLTDEEGNPIKHGPRITLCGCGKSGDLPFCDGSHKS
jgi:CDGSH-type Zn-finger protein